MERELRRLLAQVPRGRVTTYGSLAIALGDRLASRWVGYYLLHHDHRPHCTCHRVVRVDGSLGDFIAGTTSAKARRLVRERVPVVDNRVDRARYDFSNFKSTYPLTALRAAQRRAAEQVRLSAPRALPQTVAGLDVSYTSSGHAVGAYVLTEFPSGQVLWTTTVRFPAPFPYIPSFLAFRELPVLARLFEVARQADKLADTYLIDGSGVIHPHQIGVASHLGVVIDRPTIGVTKKLLCGEVDLVELRAGVPRPIVDRGHVRGAAVRPRATSQHVVFISPGNRATVDYSTRVVCPLLIGHRLPEPLYWADRLSRQAARSTSPGAADDNVSPKTRASRATSQRREYSRRCT
jgi:deoxyribonuclease V